jgi:hypothetical protein
MYALTNNNQFVRWVELRQDYPNTSFPSVITQADLPEGVVIVDQCGPIRSPEVFEVAERNAEPLLNDGVWYLAYTIRSMTSEESDAVTNSRAFELRLERNRRLSETDWTQVADAPVDKLAWAEYRKELRDISMQEGFPFNIRWPVTPNNTQGS